MVEFREIALSRESDMSLLRRFYTECFIPAFPDPDERDSLDDILDALARAQRKASENRYHLIVAVDGDIPIGGSMSDYLVAANAGVIEYLFVNVDRRRGGLGTKLRGFTEATLAADAQRNGHPIGWVVGEIDDPFRTPWSAGRFDPFTRALFWHSAGYRILDFPYIQPALGSERSPVRTLALMAKTESPQFERSIPVQHLLTFLREYITWAFPIDDADDDPSFTEMSRYLAAAGAPVALISLGDYVGGDDPTAPVHIDEITGADDPELQAVIDVYTAVFTDPATAIPPTEFRAAFTSGGLAQRADCRYHLWSIRRRGATACEGMASFVTMPGAGFGGYLGLIPPLRGSGALHYLRSRIERQMIQDDTGARGWYVECAGRVERDIFLRRNIGFHELDVPYTQPENSTVPTLATDRPLHLLYKPFGAVYGPPQLPVANFLTSMREILSTVYGLGEPRSSGTYARLERCTAGRETVPVKPNP